MVYYRTKSFENIFNFNEFFESILKIIKHVLFPRTDLLFLPFILTLKTAITINVAHENRAHQINCVSKQNITYNKSEREKVERLFLTASFNNGNAERIVIVHREREMKLIVSTFRGKEEIIDFRSINSSRCI